MITITVVNGRPVGGISAAFRQEGSDSPARRPDEHRYGQVHLHGYNIEKTVKKGVPTVIQFVAKVQGRFELELHPTDALLAQLTVQALITQLLPHVLAHGIGGVQDLPVPTWLFYWGGAFVLVVSFIAARGAVEDAPARRHARRGARLGEAFSRLVLGPVRIVVQALSVVMFVVVLAAALVGTTDPFANLAPTWIYVVFWLGLPFLSLLLGNVWRALSPWRAIADAFVWGWETDSAVRRARSRPTRSGLGRYPGRVALFAFVALELCYSNPSNPRALAFAIALYSYVALFGMLAFGRDTWTARGEGFAILFALHRAHRAARRA